MVVSKSLILAKNPTALPIIGEDLIVKASEIEISNPPPDGGIILKTSMLSYDPYQRGRMRAAGSGYVGGFPLGTPITNNSISRVVSSSSSRFKAGDVVVGNAAFSEYQLVSAEVAAKSQAQGGFDVLKNPLDLDPMLFLGALGMSGLTAYSSFYEIGKPKKGEVIFISAASGAVGQIVGQLAKREGLTVIGSVGSAEKLNFIEKELGFDSGFNYKNEKAEDALKRILKELGKDGVNIYYDNVGGEQLDAALAVLNPWGRIISCGSVSQTSLHPTATYGIKNMSFVVGKRLTIRGFIVFDPEFGPKYHDEHQKNMQKWIKNGEIVIKMSVTEGIDYAAEGLVGMLQGKNFGKAVLKIADL